MVETMEALAKTPLPTILVIAGVFFIFVGIGGGFGAHIVADKIKPKLAFIVGGTLLLIGVIVYVIPIISSQHIDTTVNSEDHLKPQNSPNSIPQESSTGVIGTGSQSSLNDLSNYLDIEELQIIFQNTSKYKIQEYYPFLIKALAKFSLADKTMLAMALATISAENKKLEPTEEQKSTFNTSPGGHPFDLYDYQKNLGNNGPYDGSTFKGRGFVQLTGRKNYKKVSEALGYGNLLIDQPDKALDPKISAEILAFFLRNNEAKIREAADRNAIWDARKMINGGSHGLERFSKVYKLTVTYIDAKEY